MSLLIEGNDSSPNPASKSNSDGNDNTSIFNSFVNGELFRIGISYAAFIIIALMLVNSQVDPNKRYTHIWVITGIYIVITLGIELLWLFMFTEKLRGKNKDATNKSVIHSIINDILPITALIFGYVILIDGFRQNINVNNVEYILRTVSVLIFIATYGYLFVTLVNTLTGDDNMNKVESALSEPFGKDNTNYTYYDNLIDSLYNLFQPISIISVAILLFFIVRMTYSSSPAPPMSMSPPVSPPPMDMSPPTPPTP
jgi:hypothetical protein